MNTSMSRHACRWNLLCILIGLAFIYSPPKAVAQCDSAAQRFVGEYLTFGDGRVVNPLWRFAGFWYSMRYDSCKVSFNYAEPYLNTERLIWQNWCQDSVHKSWEDSVLAVMSSTRPMKLHTGDTIKLYRDMMWLNPVDKTVGSSNYYAQDTISFSVELIDTATKQRVALLDSIWIKARFTRGTPELHAAPVNNPIARLIRYGVTSGLNNAVVVLRIKPIIKGIGPHYLLRRDEDYIHPSSKLCSDPVLSYLQTAFSLPVDTSICFFSTSRVDSNLSISLHSADTTGHTIHISYTGAGNDRLTTLAILPVVSNTIALDTTYIAVESRSSTGTGNVLNYTLPFGDYVAILQYNGSQVAIVQFELDVTGYSQLN